MEYWSPAPLPKGDPGKDAAAPAELRQLVEEEAEFFVDSSVGSEPEVEITGASGPPPSAVLGRKTCHIVRKIQLSKAGLAAAQQAPLATTEVGSALIGPRVEEEAAQSLGQLRGEVTPLGTSSGA